MRIHAAARGIALALILAAPLLLAVTVPRTAAAPASGTAGSGLDGKQIFLDQKCNTCHSVSTAGIEREVKSEKLAGPDLVGMVKASEGGKFADFLRQKSEIDGKKHKKAFTGSDEELGALISWLAAQKKDDG